MSDKKIVNNDDYIDNPDYYIINEWQFYLINDQTLINSYNNNPDIYKRVSRDGGTVIFDLEKNEIKEYVKYLIKGMEGSRELGSILINRYIQILIVIILCFMMFLIAQKPNKADIKTMLNNWGKNQTLIEKVWGVQKAEKVQITPNTPNGELPTVDINSVINK